MKPEDYAKKQPMAVPGFTVPTPKQESVYDKMMRENPEGCIGCGDERPTYPVPILPKQEDLPTQEDLPKQEDLPSQEDLPTEPGKKNSKR